MDVLRAVVAHRLEVEVLQDVERLEQRRSLHPAVQLVDVDAAVVGVRGLLEFDAPAREVLLRDQAALLLQPAHEFLADVAAVEALVRGHDRFLARAARGERLRLRLHQLAQRRRQVRLAEDLSRVRRLARLSEMRQHDGLRVRPLLDLLLQGFDPVGGLGVDRVAVGERDGGLQHLLEPHRALGLERERHRVEHRGNRRAQRTVAGRTSFGRKQRRRCLARRGTLAVDDDHLAGSRVVDHRRCLTAEAEVRDLAHGRGENRGHPGVDRVAALLQDANPGCDRIVTARRDDPMCAEYFWFERVATGRLERLGVGARAGREPNDGRKGDQGEKRGLDLHDAADCIE